MKDLNGVQVPSWFNGVGMHDTPGSETAVWDRDRARSHARELRLRGVTAYKLFGSATKAQRALGYADEGVLSVVRFWPGAGRPFSPTTPGPAATAAGFSARRSSTPKRRRFCAGGAWCG